MIPIVNQKLMNFKPMEFVQIVKTLSRKKMIDNALYSSIAKYFTDKHEFCNSEDISDIYKIGVIDFQSIPNFSKFADCIDMCTRKLYRSFTPQQIIRMYVKYDSPVHFLTAVARKRLMSRAHTLLLTNRMKAQDAYTLHQMLSVGVKAPEELDMIEKIEEYTKRAKFVQ